MSDAASKKAADYEAPKGVEDNRSPEQIEKDLQRVREELTDTVNELTARLDPQHLKEEAAVKARQALDDTKVKARDLASDAQGGDPKAITIIAAVAVSAGLLLRKIFR